MASHWPDEKIELHELSVRAQKNLSWPNLAAYIDALHDEYQVFQTMLNKREIGPGVRRSRRPAVRASASVKSSR